VEKALESFSRSFENFACADMLAGMLDAEWPLCDNPLHHLLGYAAYAQ
jgi:hypothetical protein